MGFFKDLKNKVRGMENQMQPPMFPRPTSMGNKFDRMFGMSRRQTPSPMMRGGAEFGPPSLEDMLRNQAPGFLKKRIKRRMPSRRPSSRFFGGGLGSILERLPQNMERMFIDEQRNFDELGMEDELPLLPRAPLPMPQDMPRERFPMMRPGFAEGEEVNMNMRIADLGANQGISPPEQRMMLIQKTAADMGRNISDRDAQLFGMGEISFEEAMSRARPSMDQVSGERNLMQQEQMFFPEKKSFRDSQQAFKGTPLGDALSYVPDLMQVADYMGLKNFAKGGEASFPDLTGDGKTTQADVLKGRGVFAEGDEVSAGPDDIQSALSDIESVAPEAQVIQQVMTMVMELVQSGASEEEIVAALRQMGLDDEDIQQVMMMLAEQMQSQQDPIQSELSEMM